MRKPIFAGNWKMNKTIKEACELAAGLKDTLFNVKEAEIIICPTFTVLNSVKDVIDGSNIKLGAQNTYWEEKGAFTGEISPVMLKDAGCKYVIIGHSERRQYFSETDQTVNRRMNAAFAHGLIPIVCVGETLSEREDDKTFDVVSRQISEGIKGLTDEQASILIIAYEPVWAIGTGKTATPEQAEEVHAAIRAQIADIYSPSIAENMRILYGGSMNPDNVSGLIKQPDIDGGLVGGASLKVDVFTQLCRCLEK